MAPMSIRPFRCTAPLATVLTACSGVYATIQGTRRGSGFISDRSSHTGRVTSVFAYERRIRCHVMIQTSIAFCHGVSCFLRSCFPVK